MNQKLTKLLRKYSKKNGFDYKSVKEEYKRLDVKSQARLLEAMRTIVG